MLDIGEEKIPPADRGEDNPFSDNGGSIFRCMEGDGPEMGLWTFCVPGLVGPLLDPGQEAALSPGPALPDIGPCVCCGGCCWEAGDGETPVRRDA